MIEITCKECGRWLGETEKTIIATIKCSNSKCKKNNNIKIITSDASDEQVRYSFSKIETEVE